MKPRPHGAAGVSRVEELAQAVRVEFKNAMIGQRNGPELEKAIADALRTLAREMVAEVKTLRDECSEARTDIWVNQQEVEAGIKALDEVVTRLSRLAGLEER
jgi:hypothetical protein